ncbi:hypothetical protein D3C80_1593480 [compost metagenome]
MPLTQQRVEIEAPGEVFDVDSDLRVFKFKTGCHADPVMSLAGGLLGLLQRRLQPQDRPVFCPGRELAQTQLLQLLTTALQRQVMTAQQAAGDQQRQAHDQ